MVKAEFLHAVGDALKADEGPGRDDGDLDNLGQLRAVREIERLQLASASREAPDEADRDSGREEDGQRDHEDVDQLLQPDAEEARHQQRRHGEQNLAQVYLVPEDGIELPHAEQTAHEDPSVQGQRRDIGPEDRKIRHREEPGRQKGKVVAESLPRIRVGAARFREGLHQIGVVHGDDHHDQSANNEAQDASHRPRLGKIGVGGHHQRAPADRRADGKRPCARRRKVLLQGSVFVHQSTSGVCLPRGGRFWIESRNCAGIHNSVTLYHMFQRISTENTPRCRSCPAPLLRAV